MTTMNDPAPIVGGADDDDETTCSECDATDGLESTYCGSFCPEHLRQHLAKCDVCREDWEA